jgi:hypothetical protein
MVSESLNWKEAYLPTLFLWGGLGAVLGLPKFSILSCILQITILLFATYWGHVAMHTITSESPFIIFNPHVFLHHNKSILLDRRVELFIEALVDFYSFFTILIAQYIFRLEIFSTSIVLYSASLYVILHILDYSLYGDDKHGLHHKHGCCNYEPEFMDVLFGTRCDAEAPHTDMSKEFIHAIIAFVFIGSLKLYLDLD